MRPKVPKIMKEKEKKLLQLLPKLIIQSIRELSPPAQFYKSKTISAIRYLIISAHRMMLHAPSMCLPLAAI